MALWMDGGTVSVTHNSKVVTGSGTAFKTSANPARPGQPIILPGGFCEIASVDSDTQITLARNYQGNTAPAEPYTVITTFDGSYNDLARRAAQVMGLYQGYMDIYAALLGGTGVVNAVLPDGREIALVAWQSLLDGAINKNKSFGLGARQGDTTNNGLSYTENNTRDFNQLITQGEFTIDGAWANGIDNGSAATGHTGMIKVSVSQNGAGLAYMQTYDTQINSITTTFVRTGTGTFPNIAWNIWETGSKRREYQAARRLVVAAEDSANNAKIVLSKRDLPATATTDIKLAETLITAGVPTPANDPEKAPLAGSETWVLDKDKKKSSKITRSRNYEAAAFGIGYLVSVDSFSIVKSDLTPIMQAAASKVTLSVPLEVANAKGAIKVDGQRSISFQDQSGVMWHMLAFGNNFNLSTGLSAENNVLSVSGQTGTITSQKDIVTVAATKRGWESYNTANFRCVELDGASGNLHAAISYPFKIAGSYALDAYIGSYADGAGADSLFHILGFTDGAGNGFNPSWGFASGGRFRYWIRPTVVGTIVSQSPMTGPSFTPTSDSRLKPDHLREDLAEASAMLRQLQPKYYFKKFDLDSEQGFYEFGFIADDVQLIEPRLVTETEDEFKLKGLSDKGIVAHLVKGWQEQDQSLASFEARLQAIERRLGIVAAEGEAVPV